MTQRRATTHISKLASLADLVIQMVNPYDLKVACDYSTDYGPEKDAHEPGYVSLLQKKYGNCSDWFLHNLETLGIQEPLVVIVWKGPDGVIRWQFDDGHHRLAWALLNNVDVPVVFDELQADEDVEDSDMFFRVGRPDVDEPHNMERQTVALVQETETYLTNMAEAQTDEFLSIPVQRTLSGARKKSKAGGKHRMA